MQPKVKLNYILSRINSTSAVDTELLTVVRSLAADIARLEELEKDAIDPKELTKLQNINQQLKTTIQEMKTKLNRSRAEVRKLKAKLAAQEQ